MVHELKISTGQYSDKGLKESNQDFHGIYVPAEPLLSSKGIAIALADGISSSDVSHVASQYAVTGLLEDYYCTSEAWSVKTSAERILNATNSWLYSQTQKSHYRYDKDKGYVCTLSAVVIKSNTAHIFHIGDSRIYLLRGGVLEQLTSDHRVWVSSTQSHLNRALGINPQLEIDYKTVQLEKGDFFVLATDGVYEYADAKYIASTLKASAASCSDLNSVAKALVEEALKRGSDDNLTLQIARIDDLPAQEGSEMYKHLYALPFPPILEARAEFDGYRIVRELHGSSRSHVYLAIDGETNQRVVIKTPSIDLQGNAAYLERFLTEEWVARRINSAHVLKACPPSRKRNYLYVVTEFIEGKTLAQWMLDNPRPGMEAVRGIVEQIAKGLRAFHRLEMLHQDLRPNNIMIDSTGTVKIIDFGSTRVASIMESTASARHDDILGTAQYTAPEYFLGESGSPASDLFSLGVITYQMLSSRLPYGAEVAKSKTQSAQRNLQYTSVLHEDREIPAWIDGVLRKAVHVSRARRYDELSEFLYDLRHPNAVFLNKTRAPLFERNPAAFWKGVSLLLALLLVVLAGLKAIRP